MVNITHIQHSFSASMDNEDHMEKIGTMHENADNMAMLNTHLKIRIR